MSKVTATSNKKKEVSLLTYKKKRKKEMRQNSGPRRGLVNAANSAARTYYRSERTNSVSKQKRQNSKLDLKTARLTQEQIKDGRYRVARARNIKRKTMVALLGTTAGAGLIAAGAAVVGAVSVGAGVAVAGNFATGVRYYAKQKRAYGGARAKYEYRSS